MSVELDFINEKEFQSEILSLTQSLRQEIEAFELGLDASKEAIKARRERVLKGDFRFFAYTYFPHHVRGEPSLFQDKICNQLPKLISANRGSKNFWVAPRGECKSSILTKISPVYVHVLALLQEPSIRKEIKWQGDAPFFNDYIVLLGAETKMPTKLMEVSKMELEVNPALALDFPEVVGRTNTWKVGEYVSKTGVKVEPFGAEQAIRGTFFGASRPKILLGDDLITDKEAKSPTERENRWNWLEKAIDYLGSPDGTVKFMGVGTILNSDDLISRAKNTLGYRVHHFKAIEEFPNNMELWDRCEEVMRNQDEREEKRLEENEIEVTNEKMPSYKFYLKYKKEMDEGAIISWPSVRSLYWLMKQRAKNRKAFGTEMQGDARSDEDRVFTDLNYWVHTMEHWIYLGGCDPSMGKTQKSDPSAIVVGGFDLNTSKLNVAVADSKRRVPSKLLSDLIRYQKEYNVQGWGFENNSAFEYMRSEFMKQAVWNETMLPLIPVTVSTPLDVRIESMEPYISDMDAIIAFLAKLKTLIDQLNEWPDKPSGHHYDLLSALYLLWHVAATRSYGVANINLPEKKRRQSGIDTRGYD